MIAYIKGKIIQKQGRSVTVLADSGMGYEVSLSFSHYSTLKIKQDIELFTYLKMSDSAAELYGFANIHEKEFFSLLLSVSGIGPKGAMNILDLGSIEQIKAAIARSDSAYLTQVQGMGKKTAERMVVELRSKVKVDNIEQANKADYDSGKLTEVVGGLMAMGYSKEEAKNAVRGLETADKSTEELLKQALNKS